MTMTLFRTTRPSRTTAPLLGIAALAALGLAASPQTAHAQAPIAWSAPTNISADSNVNNAGITLGAFRLGNTGLTAATVNGVTFMSLGVPDNTNTVTSGNFSLNLNLSFSTNTACGTTAGAYGQLPAATQNLLQSGSFSQNNQITLTMSGLTVGRAYTFEWWANNAGNFTGYGYQLVRGNSGSSPSATNSVTLTANTGTPLGNSPAGGVGQFVVGTFTANTTSQAVSFTSTNDAAILNAFQLRTAAPEPSSVAALAIGLLGLGALAVKAKRRVA